MSGVFKAVGKVFKPIIKAAKVIVPVVLAAAAIYFTAGAALGATAAWGTTVSSFVGTTLGATSTLGGVLTGAITYAGYGAVAGGVLAGVQGKNVLKGAGKGALVGAAVGGTMGAMGMTPATNLGALPNANALAAEGNSMMAAMQPGAAAPVVDPNVFTSMPAGMAPQGLPGAAGAAGASGAGGASAIAPSSLVGAGEAAAAPSGMMKFMDTAAGAGLVAGVGQGLLSSGEADATLEAEREERADRRANYGGAGAGLYTGTERPTLRQQASRTAPDPLDPAGAEGSYQYDPRMGRVVWVS